MSTATPFAVAVVRCAEHSGVDGKQMLRRAGVHPSLLDDATGRIPTESYLSLLVEAAASTGNAKLGPTLARFIDPATFGLLGFIVASSATLGDAFVRLAKYSRVLCDELSIEVALGRSSVHVVYGMDAQPHVPAFFEMALTHLATTARRGTHGSFAPIELTFRHPRTTRAPGRAFGVPVRWNASEDALVCAREALDLRLRGANPPLLAILEAHAAHVIHELPPRDDLLHHARAVIRAMLTRRTLSVEAVARRMGVGSRTLQRRLRECGLSFRDLLDDVRREGALLQLARPEARIADVAFAAGFSSPSAFHHAFRRWTGHAPGRRPAKPGATVQKA